MPLLDHLPANGVMVGVSATSKKQLLEHISAYAGPLTGVPARAIFDALTQRVVIISTPERAVVFDVHNKKPVDIICTTLCPDQANCDHLKLVSMAAKHLTDGNICRALRGAKTASDIRHCFEQHRASAA